LSPPPAPRRRIATVDWTIAETLLALGSPRWRWGMWPYRAWVGEPQLPAGVIDIGLRAQPNRELLAELKPDLILISPLAAPWRRPLPHRAGALHRPV
jgi:iron complex transport system substrate-binding protein